MLGGGGITGGLGDLLAMFANLTKEMNRRMEKVAESGSSLFAGLCISQVCSFSFSDSEKDVVSDVLATIMASRDKVTDILSRLV